VRSPLITIEESSAQKIDAAMKHAGLMNQARPLIQAMAAPQKVRSEQQDRRGKPQGALQL
jgi:hypothetical protein